MATTIQISEKLQQELAKRKLFDKETYEEVIWDLIEDTLELSKDTKKNIKTSLEQFKRGEYKTLDQIEKELGM